MSTERADRLALAAIRDMRFVRRDVLMDTVIAFCPRRELHVEVSGELWARAHPMLAEEALWVPEEEGFTASPEPVKPMSVPGLVDPLDTLERELNAILADAELRWQKDQADFERDHKVWAEAIDARNRGDDFEWQNSVNVYNAYGYRINGGWATDDTNRFTRHRRLLEAYPEWPKDDDVDRSSHRYGEELAERSRAKARRHAEENRRRREYLDREEVALAGSRGLFQSSKPSSANLIIGPEVAARIARVLRDDLPVRGGPGGIR